MKYVCLIYDDGHGLLCICATPEKATKQVKDEAFGGGLPEDTPLDYECAEHWGLGWCCLVGKRRGY